MEARKGNKLYQIDKTQADAYAAQGYDIFDGKKLVKHGAGKSVSIEAYEKVLAENEELKAKLAAKDKKADKKD